MNPHLGPILGLALFVCGAALPALAEDMPMSMPMKTMPAPGKGMAADAHQAMKEAMGGMMQSMNAPSTGNVDKDFAAMMLPHHQAAVDMAEVELRSGKDPVLRKLARAVVETQNSEIAAMKTWQAKHP